MRAGSDIGVLWGLAFRRKYHLKVRQYVLWPKLRKLSQTNRIKVFRVEYGWERHPSLALNAISCPSFGQERKCVEITGGSTRLQLHRNFRLHERRVLQWGKSTEGVMRSR